jgi:nicotinamidase-related amidase
MMELIPRRSGLRSLVFVHAGALAFLVMLTTSYASGQDKTIIDEWAAVQPPKPPELKPVTVEPKATALLVLDIVKPGCNMERRPRCVASVPRIQNLLKEARGKGMAVVHSLTSATKPPDILPEVAPREGEPIVQAPADKFFRTDLEKILKDKGIKTVIVVGTAAHGAVLNTGSQAAFRGFQVVLPVDGMSSENTYFEQYVAYHMTTAPGVGARVILTRADMIKF